MCAEKHWLSTGEAARLCSVARDTVVKWIRRGRLPASRTAGGHYRSAWGDVQRVAPPEHRRAEESLSNPTDSAERPMRCWGYLSDTGAPREECRQCLAYRVGATWCFLLRKEQEAGSVSFCSGPESCEDCPYYRRVMGLSTRVLVITADEALEQSLCSSGEEDLECHFARTGYEAAALISGFYPLIAVVDADVDRDGGARLVAQLTDDTRIHGLRIIFAVPRRGARQTRGLEPGRGLVEVLRKPFGLSELRSVRDRLPVEPLEAEQMAEVAEASSGIAVSEENSSN